MSTLAVQKVRKPELAPSFFKSMDTLFADVRNRAFELFEKRGSVHGFDLDDWCQAEHDLCFMPESKLVETDREFRMKVALPTMEAKNIHVSALPGAVVIHGETSQREEKTEGKVHLSEFSAKKLFRRFDLPASIDIEEVTATFENGILQVVAPKAAAPAKRQVAVAA
jgi:HSP20 family protein